VHFLKFIKIPVFIFLGWSNCDEEFFPI
jgi:hypothetical protein